MRCSPPAAAASPRSGCPAPPACRPSAVAEHARRAVQRRARSSTTDGGRGDRRTGRRQHGRGRPGAGFLEGLRAECDRVGALLVFDEVITGFRLGPGGAQAKYDVRPDLTTFGKVIGGGLPIGAVGGRREIMETLSPLGPVFHAGTLAGNPLATAAGLAALDQLTDDVYIELLGPGPPPVGGACATPALRPASPPSSRSSARWSGCTSATVPRPTNFADAKTHRRAGLRRVLPRHARARASRWRPVRTRRCSSALAHTDDVLDEIAAAAHRAATEATDPTC